jgi:hypothetical protein
MALGFFISMTRYLGANSSYCPRQMQPGSNLHLISSCVFPGAIDGIDGGSLVVESGATLTIQQGQSLVRNVGQSITINGSIVLIGTGKIIQTNLWCLDQDQDAWCYNFTSMVAQDLRPPGYSRLSQAKSTLVPDCNDLAYSATNNCGGVIYPY